MCRVSRSPFEGVRIAPHIIVERFLSWTGKSARLVPLSWFLDVLGNGVALKPGAIVRKDHNHARQDGNLPVLPRARHAATRDAFPPSALGRIHYRRTTMVVQARLIVGVRGVSHTYHVFART